ncbi:MAG TPA: HEAT repeat domain-containing protein [Myxococcota bacterium]|nr:HEAT repeat domain-containing protein [Myxococcota bacterium]
MLELARAARARRVHPVGHPVVVDALQRGTAVWRALAGADGEVTLDVRDTALSIAEGARLACPGAAELAGDLRAHGVAKLRLRSQAQAQDLSHLIEILTRAPAELVAAGGAREALRATGARGVELAGVTPDGDDGAADSAGAGSYVTQHVSELVRLLAELERCDDVGGYNLLANKVGACVEVLVREKRCVDGFRAALVFCRHATDAAARSDAIRREASDRLRRLAVSAELLASIVEQACTATGLASVQATQVLIAIGAPAAGVLLRYCAETRDSSRERAAQVLIAMGDNVLAAVVDDLRDGSSERARRAARMLGEMQNPGGVQFLADALRAPDLALAREAARALARIATDPAAAALVAGLKLSPSIAETCAGCLGGLRQGAAARALGELLDLERDVPDGLRREAIRSLGRLASAEALTRLKRVLDHAPLLGRARFRPLRVAAAQAIGQIGGAIALQTLQPHARRGDPEVRQACQEAIRRVERAVREK